MTRATIAGGAFAALLVLLALVEVTGRSTWVLDRDVHPAAATPPAITPGS